MERPASGRTRRLVIGLLVALLVLATGPGIALAAPVQGVAGRTAWAGRRSGAEA